MQAPISEAQVNELRRVLHRLTFPSNLDLVEFVDRGGLDINALFTTWCHSSHGDQTLTALGYCGELRHFFDATDGEFAFGGCIAVRTLLDMGARVDTSPVVSNLFRCPVCVRAVVAEGANVNASVFFHEFGRVNDDAGRTGLERAISYSLDLVKMFVEEFFATYDLEKCIMICSKARKFDVLEYLAIEIPLYVCFFGCSAAFAL